MHSFKTVTPSFLLVYTGIISASEVLKQSEMLRGKYLINQDNVVLSSGISLLATALRTHARPGELKDIRSQN